jgi:hypothetical protein
MRRAEAAERWRIIDTSGLIGQPRVVLPLKKPRGAPIRDS